MSAASREATGKFSSWLEPGGESNSPPADVRIVTSGGDSIAAHAFVLAMASPVLDRRLDRIAYKDRGGGGGGGGGLVLPILGAPSGAVRAFAAFLYASRWTGAEEQRRAMDLHGEAILALAHAYGVPWLKCACEDALSRRVCAADAVDALQLARWFDAPRLYRRCMRIIRGSFDAVSRSGGWRFLQAHDPRLELEILRYMDHADTMAEKKIRRKRKRAEEKAYLQLAEAMDCLAHICREGCIGVRPNNTFAPSMITEVSSCPSYPTCQVLRVLIRHFTSCGQKVAYPRRCGRCGRMLQLFRLHSYICEDEDDTCKVPLCRHFKIRAHLKGGEDDEMWRLLAKKVSFAKAMSLIVKRKCEDYACTRHTIRTKLV